MKSEMTPAGFTWIIWHMPLKALSFSSLSLMFRNDIHLKAQKLRRWSSTYSNISFHECVKHSNLQSYLEIVTKIQD